MPDPDQLRDDHKAIDVIFDDVFAALDCGDRPDVFESLDRIWARLAVHIRAEHLHLFPALIIKTGSYVLIEEVIAGLREDHNFFMAELGSLVKQWRLSGNPIEDAARLGSLSETKERIDLLRKRLISHNEIEETQVYSLVDAYLSEADRSDLYANVRRELTNMPSRFRVLPERGSAVLAKAGVHGFPFFAGF